MARHSSSNPLAQALDKRVRAVVDEALDEALRGSIRRLIQQELAAALGSADAPAAIGARRAGRPPGRRVQARGRQRVEEGLGARAGRSGPMGETGSPQCGHCTWSTGRRASYQPW